MLNKKYSKDKKTCKVTFELPAEVGAKTVHLHGDFTGWEKSPKKNSTNTMSLIWHLEMLFYEHCEE